MHTDSTHVFKHSLHEGDGNLGFLDEVVLGILNVEPCLLLFRGICGLQPNRPTSVTPSQDTRDILRLLSCIEFKSARTNGLAGLHCDVDRG